MAVDIQRVVIDIDVKDAKLINELMAQLKAVANEAPKAQEAFRKSTKKTQIEMRQFGRGVQNASYQIQDFIVQVTNGVDPLRSFAQQAPQLLINMGALGGVIGVVAAGLPVLIAALSDSSDEVSTLDQAVTQLDESMSDLDSALARFQKSGSEFDRLLVNINRAAADSALTDWIREFNEGLDPSKLQIIGEKLSNIVESMLADISGGWLKSVIESLKISNPLFFSLAKSIDLISEAWGGLEDSAEAAQLRIENLVETFDLGEVDAQRALVALELLEKGAWSAEDAFLELKYIAESFDTTLGTGKGLVKYINDLRDAENATRTFATSTIEGLKLVEVQAQTTFQKVDPTEYTNKWLDALNLQAQETGRIVRSFQETVEEGTNFDNNKIAEQFSLAEESVLIFSRTFDTAFNGVAMGTQSVSDAVTNMVKTIIAQLGKLAALKGIEMLFPSLRGQLVPNAKGNVFSGGNVVPFAKGGVVNSPTIFPLARGGVGLMGEKGSEAIMPLARTPSGDLGVQATGMSVTVNNMSPAQIRTTQTDSGVNIDVIMDTIASAVQRGGNQVADALESTYPINRGARVY